MSSARPKAATAFLMGRRSLPTVVAPMLAFDAVAALREAGYQARRLEDGFPEWKAESRPRARRARFEDLTDSGHVK